MRETPFCIEIPCISLLSFSICPFVHVLLVVSFLLILLLAKKYKAAGRREGSVLQWKSIVLLQLLLNFFVRKDLTESLGELLGERSSVLLADLENSA